MSTEEVCQRYLKLYTGAIADMLDKRGFRNQVLPRDVTPFTNLNRVAGPALPGKGIRLPIRAMTTRRCG
jgi:hypothetical protein